MDPVAASGRSRLSMRRLHHSGMRPIRVLVIGDGTPLNQPLTGGTLAERAADRIWLGTRRGVDLDVLTDLAPVLRAVHGAFRTWRLWRYDVVVVLIGDGTDAARRPRALARIGELLGEVLQDAATATDVVVLGPADVGTAGRRRHAASPADRLRAEVDALRSDRIRFRAVPTAEEPLEQARAWASAVGIEVAASVERQAVLPRATTATARRDVADDEVGRQRALDALGRDRGPDARLDDLVELARSAFGTESAAVNFIDRDQQWRGAVVGAGAEPAPRRDSFCDVTIQRAEPTVVSDARADPIFRSSPLVRGPHPIRFYAGYPIESAEGFRIGSFCIFDSSPRDVAGIDLSVLRDLALMAQREITGVDAAPVKGSRAAG